MAYRKVEMKPRKIDLVNTYHVRARAKELLHNCGLSLPETVTIWAVNQRRGEWNGCKNYLTVPVWAVTKDNGFFTYYVAHELAHAVCRFRYPHEIHHHDIVFMEIFKEICPVESQHHEYGYKPRAAKAAGVSRKV